MLPPVTGRIQHGGRQQLRTEQLQQIGKAADTRRESRYAEHEPKIGFYAESFTKRAFSAFAVQHDAKNRCEQHAGK